MPEAGWRKLTGEEEFRELRGHGGGSHPAVAVKFHLYQDTVEGLLGVTRTHLTSSLSV